MNTDTDNASKDGSTDILRTIARANGMMLQGDIPGAESVLDEVIVGVRQLMAERDALRAYRPVAAALVPNRRYTTSEDGWRIAFNDGWNACVAAILATAPSHSQQSDSGSDLLKQENEKLRAACQLAYQTPLDEFYARNVYHVLASALGDTDSRPAHDSEKADRYPPPQVIDEWRSHCSCCPHCCNHPCDGVAAGGMCDSAECDCFDEESKQHDQL